MKDIAYTLWQEPEGWVIQCLFTGVTTCGKTAEEAIKKLPEAVELYLSDRPEEDFPRKNIQFGNMALHA